MSVSEGLIHASLHGHVFGTLHVCLNNHNVFISGVQHKGFTYLVGVAKLSAEQVFQYRKWPIGDGLLSVIRSSGVSTIQGFLMYGETICYIVGVRC